VIVQETSTFRTRLADDYAAFNPDRDTITRHEAAPAERDAAYSSLIDRLRYLLTKANFVEVTEDELREAMDEANSQGLRLVLDRSRIDDLRLFFRGRGTVPRTQRYWRTWWRAREVEVPVFRRFAVLVKLRDAPWLLLKLFKNIPRMDIEALLPHARVAMNLLDRIKVAGSGSTAIASSAYKLIFALSQWSLLTWTLIVAAGVATIRTISGYKAVKTQRDAIRTRNLYFQNLDNNAGVIHALAAMVCEEEAKEALLAYAFCLTADPPLRDTDELDNRIESFLKTHFSVEPNFEIADAVETLSRLRLHVNHDALIVHEPDEAAMRLVEHWQTRATVDYHEMMTTH
jgi:hypothetical protein